MESDKIYQRTESGRDEIMSKSHALTQSERLVLIIVDGVTPYSGLSYKLRALENHRFERAVYKLIQAGLIMEVMFQEISKEAEALDIGVVNQYLKQDVLDPVSVISTDPEDAFQISAEIELQKNDDDLNSNNVSELDQAIAIAARSIYKISDQQIKYENDLLKNSGGIAKVDIFLPLKENDTLITPVSSKKNPLKNIGLPIDALSKLKKTATLQKTPVSLSASNEKENFRFLHWSYILLLLGVLWIILVVVLRFLKD